MPNPLVGNALLGQGMTLNVNDIVGPALYVTGGVNLSVNAMALTSGIYMVPMDLTVSGTYYVRVLSPSGPGVTSFKVKWFTASNNTEVANNTVLSAETLRVMMIGVG